MVSNYTELGDKIGPMLQEDLDPFGIELVKFQITSTSLPKQVEEFYDKMTNMNMVDDMNKFQQFQQADAIVKAAENTGGGASEGVGLGIGMTLANQMMNNNQQQQQQQPNVQARGVEPPKQESRADIISALKELGSLKEMGILTQEEFDGKKKELLARL